MLIKPTPEKQIPAIAQVGEKVGINIEAPLGTLHISGSGGHGSGTFGAATPLIYLKTETLVFGLYTTQLLEIERSKDQTRVDSLQY